MAAKSSVGDRIMELVTKMNMTAFEFSAKLGYSSTSEFSRIRNGKPVSEVVIMKILKAFPEINRDWLLHGTGSPLKEGFTELKEPLIEYSKHRDRTVPDIKHDPNGKKIPKFDITVYASIIPSLGDAMIVKPSAFINIPLFSQGECAVNCTGHSMKGIINHGDLVVIKRLTNSSSIVPGEAHMIITKADRIRTFKYIKLSEIPNHIKLVSYNADQFEPYDLHVDDILEIWKVIGIFRGY